MRRSVSPLSYLSLADRRFIAKLPKERRAEIRKNLKAQIKPLSIGLADQRKDFFRCVGVGITRWVQMEELLVLIAARLLRTTNEKAGLVLYSINNFHTWIQIIGDLFVIDDTYKKSHKMWRNIFEDLKRQNDFRVRLAHHAMSQEKYDTEGEIGYQAYLRPSKLDLRTKSKKQQPLSFREFVTFFEAVSRLENNLIEIVKRMKKRKSLR